MMMPKARWPPVRYASRARPGPPEKATKKTPSPMSNQGARKPTISMRARILPERRTPLSVEFGAHPVERIPDQPGDVHLRDSDPLGDLRLREALEEAQMQDRALACGQA